MLEQPFQTALLGQLPIPKELKTSGHQISPIAMVNTTCTTARQVSARAGQPSSSPQAVPVYQTPGPTKALSLNHMRIVVGTPLMETSLSMLPASGGCPLDRSGPASS